MTDLIWREGIPEEDGWYWVRAEKFIPWVSWICDERKMGVTPPGEQLTKRSTLRFWELDGYDMEFAGPIPEPKEASE